MTIYAIDFGMDDALAIHGPTGAVPRESLWPKGRMPKWTGGGPRPKSTKVPLIIETLMAGAPDRPAGDVVFESPTIGSSGCEVGDIEVLLTHGRRLFTLSAHAVKNYRKDHGLGWKKGARYAKDGAEPPVTLTLEEQESVHTEDAEILYRIATETPGRLHEWKGPSSPCQRVHRSVRPMDQRGYRDERSLAFLSLLPPYESLPEELRLRLGTEKGYAATKVMPFAMASTEPYLDEGPREERRRRYEKIIGLYDRGYPSFYRRETIEWMQEVAKELAGCTRMEDVPAEVRKQAWKITQRQIRMFFHITMEHQGR